MDNFLLMKETYEIIGVCMEVQRTLGYGFSEAIYKDDMEMEFCAKNLLYNWEEELSVNYKGKKLQHRFFC